MAIMTASAGEASVGKVRGAFPAIYALCGNSRDQPSEGMGFRARGFIRLHPATGDAGVGRKAEMALLG